jgi:hypothetical protein
MLKDRRMPACCETGLVYGWCWMFGLQSPKFPPCDSFQTRRKSAGTAEPKYKPGVAENAREKLGLSLLI